MQGKTVHKNKTTKKNPQGSTIELTFINCQVNYLKLLSSHLKTCCDMIVQDQQQLRSSWQTLMSAVLKSRNAPRRRDEPWSHFSEWLIKALFVSGTQPYTSIPANRKHSDSTKTEWTRVMTSRFSLFSNIGYQLRGSNYRIQKWIKVR